MASKARTVEMPATCIIKRQGFHFVKRMFQPVTEVVETFERQVERAAQDG